MPPKAIAALFLFFALTLCTLLPAAARSAPAETTLIVTGQRVNLRADPHLNAPVRAQLDKGDRVVLTSQTGKDWLRVRLDDGSSGWMNRRFLRPASSPATGPGQPDASPPADLAGRPALRPDLRPGLPADVPRDISALPVSSGRPFAVPRPGAAPTDLNFTLVRKGSKGPTVLVFGGIQGDEPGGFSAASLLTTHYEISHGTLLIAPNLNFPSIIARSRGASGDMNRKFAQLAPNDPQYRQVRATQSLIMQPEVDMVLNLHDGYGFFRPQRESLLANPARWGQSVIVDRAQAPGCAFTNLADMADKAAAEANTALLRPEHRFFVKNTRTDEGNVEMARTLSWFAVRNGKTAFGLEASKELPVAERAYYHLLLVESFLRQAGIVFHRPFPLTPAGVRAALGDDVHVAFLDGRARLPLANIRPQLAGYLPLPKSPQMTASSPILAVTSPRPGSSNMQIHYGNNLLTSFAVRHFESDASLDSLAVLVDGQRRQVRFGETLVVERSFTVEPKPGYRVNAIGTDRNAQDESGLALARRDFVPAYSLDRNARLFRVETYRGNRLVGMFLVDFDGNAMTAGPLPDGRPTPSRHGR